MNQLLVLRLVCLVIGYAFGIFQTAYILGRSKGIDIREYGSGNAGTTNAMRILGTKAGLIVFLGDMIKSLLALLLVGFLFGKSHPEAIYLLKTWTFAGVVLGHDYPFYMNFKGGKGVAVMAGYVFGFHWSFIPVGILLFFVPYLTTKYVSLGSLLLYLGLFIQHRDPGLSDCHGLVQAPRQYRQAPLGKRAQNLYLQTQFGADQSQIRCPGVFCKKIQ